MTDEPRSILVDPPRMIAVDQRVKYSAMASTVLMAELALSDLRALLVPYADQSNPTGSGEERFRALNLAWSIVDQADLLRHLITSEGSFIQLAEAAAFLTEAEAVREVRNWMRHIPQRIDGYLKRKEPLPPALGALSFTVVRRTRDGVPIAGEVADADILEYHTHVLPGSTFQRGFKLEGAPIEYTSFKVPIDHLFLQAFGTNLSLERVVAAMSGFCDEMSRAVRRFVDAKVAELKASGHYQEALEQPAYEAGSLYTMVAKRD